METTTNYGFPLLGPTPPENMTGLDLRNLILGTDNNSLSNMVDNALYNIQLNLNDTSGFVPLYMLSSLVMTVYPKLGKYKSESFNIDSNISNNLAITIGNNEYRKVTSSFVTNTDTLELNYTLTDTGSNPNITVEVGHASNKAILDLKDMFGITIYEFFNFNVFQYGVVVADRSGTLPASVIENITGSAATNINYESGMYVLSDMLKLIVNPFKNGESKLIQINSWKNIKDDWQVY